MSQKIYALITDRVIAMLERGTVPWSQPWSGGEPKNLVSKKPYRGINAFLLSTLASEYFVTFKQAKMLGGTIKKGSHSMPVIFWTFIDSKDTKTAEPKKIPFLRYYNVFAVSDVDGIEDKIPVMEKKEKRKKESLEGAQIIINKMPDPPKITTGGNRAYYTSLHDQVYIPDLQAFRSSEDYYSTLFHELVHSTGHAKRLNRKEVSNILDANQETYSKEELIAEMGSAFLCNHAQIDSSSRLLEDQAAYISSWLKVLRNDTKMLVSAAGKAQHAADFILGKAATDKD